VEALLNAGDEENSRRRRLHHLPDPCYADSHVVYCVTLCARHHGAPFLHAPVAEGVLAALRFYREKRFWIVYAYCLMPDHLHAILRLPEPDAAPAVPDPAAPPQNLKRLISDYKRYTTTQVAWRHGFHGKLWQRDFYDHLARGSKDAEAQCRYVLENPVRKGLVKEWGDYPWSGSMDEWM